MTPLYMAPMMDWVGPSLTKKVPMIEVMMQMPPIASGNIIMRRSTSGLAVRKKIAARTMVATVVTT